MAVPQFIRKALTGLTIPQEYCCLESINFPEPSRVILTQQDGTVIADITNSHIFLGYSPLIIGVFSDSMRASSIGTEMKMNFYPSNASTPVASIVMSRILDDIPAGDKVIRLFEGKQGDHHFIGKFHQWFNDQREKRKKKKVGNIALPGNLADQVRIAYSVPRNISLITVSDGLNMNLFPTDLHGPVGDRYYMGSLRSKGMAHAEVMQYGRIVISEIRSSEFKAAYLLGKNHMQPLKAPAEFDLNKQKSEKFGFPLPAGVNAYRELERINSANHGIHNLHLYKVVSYHQVGEERSSLGHVHQYYIQWRQDHGIQTEWLKR